MKVKGRTVRRAPKMSSLVVSAIRNLREIHGSTSKEIMNYIKSNYDAKESTIQRQMQTALKRGLEYGILKRTDGNYSLNVDGTAPFGVATPSDRPVRRRGNNRRGRPKARVRARASRRRRGKSARRRPRAARAQQRGECRCFPRRPNDEDRLLRELEAVPTPASRRNDDATSRDGRSASRDRSSTRSRSSGSSDRPADDGQQREDRQDTLVKIDT